MAQAQFKILVVDDEPDLEHLVRQRMRRDVRAGRYLFAFAHNGIEALEILNEDPDIDMVLTDINMPQMDGLTLLEQIPKVDPNIRSVIVSAYGDMKNIRTAMNRGAFGLCYQTHRLSRPADHHRSHLAPLGLVARCPRFAGQTGGVAKRTARRQRNAAVDFADPIPGSARLSGVWQHGARARSGRRTFSTL